MTNGAFGQSADQLAKELDDLYGRWPEIFPPDGPVARRNAEAALIEAGLTWLKTLSTGVTLRLFGNGVIGG